jgi:hypothetical protein
MDGTRGIPKGQAPRRLTDNQRQIIISALANEPNCTEVTRWFNATVGEVSLATVCAIKRRAIERGTIKDLPLDRAKYGIWWVGNRHTPEAIAKMAAAMRSRNRAPDGRILPKKWVPGRGFCYE